MSHNIDFSNNQANIAFLGDRKDIWHKLGQEMKPGMSTEEWARCAGLDWEAVKVPVIPALAGERFDHIDAAHRFLPAPNRKAIVRSDTGACLGIGSDGYEPHQPKEVLDWFDRYIHVDDRFQLDVAGSLRGGAVIWATAVYRDALSVAGDKHIARVLMTTTFDASGATINKGTMTRVVCNNTLDGALADKRCEIRTRHNTKFDAARVGKELAAIAQGFAQYKKLGDALAQNEMAREEVSLFFKQCLDIPFDAKKDDVSTVKLNQFAALNAAYKTTVAEGATGAWAALNAITRWVDHKSDDMAADKLEKAFTSAQFGHGADIKATAWNLLVPRIADKATVAA